MRSIARRHPLAVFLAFSYGAAALLFALPLLSSAGLGIIDLELPGVAPFVLLSAIALAGAAFAATALAEGRDGVRELRGRVFRFRVKPGWYVVALTLLPATGLVAAAVLSGFAPVSALISDPGIAISVAVGAVFAFLLVNWWEEVGWTGFALERLQPRIGPVASSVVTTWLQALIHVPLVFVTGGVTDGRVPADQIPFFLVALFVLPIPVRIVLTAIYNASNRSLPIVGLYHAGLGVATGSAFLPVLAPGITPIVAYAGFAVLAVLVLVATRGRLGFMGSADAAPASAAVMA